MDSDRLDRQRVAVAAAHRRLHESVEQLRPAGIRQPTLLPGWSVGHVLGHLEQHALSVLRRLEAAAEGDLVEHYPAGPDGRASAIETASRRDVRETVAGLISADHALDLAFAQVDVSVWQSPVRLGGGRIGPASSLLFARWREVETHHADLQLGYTWADWPTELVDEWLPRLLSGLTDRAEHRQLMAWALGRAQAPALRPWG